ncbi:MAG: YicC family protein [Candidatus Omnitrophica bacterium]|nr:YicC family protein [Candidatus Omnitrophota bacterium]
MLRSMTGFGSCELGLKPFGKVSVEIRSINHKFLEILIHLPEGSLSLEERIKRIIESKIKRGRVTCSINISGTSKAGDVFINKALVKKYMARIKEIKQEFKIEEGVNLDTLINLPGVLTLKEETLSSESLWSRLEGALDIALNNLVKTRSKEGRALEGYLKKQAESLKEKLGNIRERLKKSLKEKLKSFVTDEERAGFLKETDIGEEIDRLQFHIRNFKSKITKDAAIGKELDFIAQEMQREANTLAAKTFDVGVSSLVLQMKGSIEKIREQVQNIE